MTKVTYVDDETVIYADNLNEIQDVLIDYGTSKQDKLIAGKNIHIASDGVTISATGGGGSGSDVIMEDNAGGGVDLTVDDDTRTLAKESELHSHSNKAILDATTAAFTTEQASAISTNTTNIATNTTAISELNADLVHIKDMTSTEEQAGTYAEYHLGFYLDANGDLCQKED